MKYLLPNLTILSCLIQSCGGDEGQSSSVTKLDLLTKCETSKQAAFSLEYDSIIEDFKSCSDGKGACQGFAIANLDRSLASCGAAANSSLAFDQYIQGKELEDLK